MPWMLRQGCVSGLLNSVCSAGLASESLLLVYILVCKRNQMAEQPVVERTSPGVFTDNANAINIVALVVVRAAAEIQWQ